MDRPSLLLLPDSAELAFSQRVFKTEEFCDWLMTRTDLGRAIMLGQLQRVARRAGFKAMHLVKWCVAREEEGRLFVYVGWHPGRRTERNKYEILLRREDLLAAEQAAEQERIQRAVQQAARREMMRAGVRTATAKPRRDANSSHLSDGSGDEEADSLPRWMRNT